MAEQVKANRGIRLLCSFFDKFIFDKFMGQRHQQQMQSRCPPALRDNGWGLSVVDEALERVSSDVRSKIDKYVREDLNVVGGGGDGGGEGDDFDIDSLEAKMQDIINGR